MMSKKLLAVLFCWLAMAVPASAVTITQIEVGNVFGRVDYYQPGSFNYFGVLGAPRYYVLDTGERFEPGAGWIPYTNATSIQEQVDASAGVIRYAFTGINNWAGGSGVLFYHSGQLLSGTSTQVYWSEGTLLPASPLVLVASLGSSTATLTGLAQVATPASAGGGDAAFAAYAAPAGAIVPFHAEFTLLEGATWQPGVFDTTFKYTMSGVISFAPVPEPGSAALMLAGAGLLAASLRRRRLSQP